MNVRPTPPDEAKLNLSLTNISPTDEQVMRIEALRHFAKSFGLRILRHCPPSREQSLAITKLEESVMWAVKGILLNESTFETFDGSTTS